MQRRSSMDLRPATSPKLLKRSETRGLLQQTEIEECGKSRWLVALAIVPVFACIEATVMLTRKGACKYTIGTGWESLDGVILGGLPGWMAN